MRLEEEDIPNSDRKNDPDKPSLDRVIKNKENDSLYGMNVS